MCMEIEAKREVYASVAWLSLSQEYRVHNIKTPGVREHADALAQAFNACMAWY